MELIQKAVEKHILKEGTEITGMVPTRGLGGVPFSVRKIMKFVSVENGKVTATENNRSFTFPTNDVLEIEGMPVERFKQAYGL